MIRWCWLLARSPALRRCWGQGLVEYALLLIFVAVVLIALLVVLGPGVRNTYSDIIEAL
jgi:pilus assembly protein Flp/PilA